MSVTPYPKRQSERLLRRGSAVVVLAVMLLVAFAIASYSINVVYMEFARTELQITADLSTRAACRALVDTGQQSQAQAAAQRLANANPVRGQIVEIPLSDLEFAVATRYEEDADYLYSAQRANPNSVHLAASFFQRSQGGLEMLFPSLGVPIDFRPLKDATATQSELDLAIVLDCSSSMGWSATRTSGMENLVELPPVRRLPPDTRWRDAEAGIAEVLSLFRDSPQRELVSLSTFGTTAQTDQRLTSEYEALTASLAFHGDHFRGGFSSLYDGIQNGLSLLSDDSRARPWASRVLLLISDGRGNIGSDPLQAARAASDEYVMIHTISLSDEANQSLMQDIASAAQGQHFHADNATQFRTILQEITRRLPILITH